MRSTSRDFPEVLSSPTKIRRYGMCGKTRRDPLCRRFCLLKGPIYSHLPVILSHDSDTDGKTFPPTYSYRRADWALFTQLTVITDAMVKTDSVDTAVQEVTNVLIAAADFNYQRVQVIHSNITNLGGMLIVRQHIRTKMGNLSQISHYGESLGILKVLAEVWKEHCFPSSWRETIVIPILKPGKVATDPLSYRSSSSEQWDAVRYFNVRIGHSSSHKFIQDQGVPQGSILSVTLFNIHMSNILHQLPPSVQGMLYVDDLQVSCQGSDMRLIERQLQTTVNRLVQWCDQNGHTISPSKSSCVHFCRKRNLHPEPSIHILHIQIPVVSAVRFVGVFFDCKLTCLPLVLYLRKRCERSLNILKVLSNTLWGADSLVTPSVPGTNTFTTSPVTSLYVVCHQPPLELRRRQLSANYFIRAMSVPSHPLKPFALAIGLNRLYEAR
ncbi:putative RNA-directed DNA polymerase from transposon X-element [Trichonephila clavipes]|nr:putative RNA-directed DNA polymerase from transposon X-element [Trichonephila clavipes]